MVQWDITDTGEFVLINDISEIYSITTHRAIWKNDSSLHLIENDRLYTYKLATETSRFCMLRVFITSGFVEEF